MRAAAKCVCKLSIAGGDMRYQWELIWLATSSVCDVAWVVGPVPCFDSLSGATAATTTLGRAWAPPLYWTTHAAQRQHQFDEISNRTDSTGRSEVCIFVHL